MKIDLETENGLPVQAELTIERYRELELRPGRTVYVSVRDVRLFVDADREAFENRLYALTGIRCVSSQ